MDAIENAGEVQLLQTEAGRGEHSDERREHSDEHKDRDQEEAAAADTGASLGETAKTESTATMTTDTTQGMYDGEVRVEQEFSSFDNEMASLSTAIGDSDHGVKKKAKKMGDLLVQMGAGRDDDDDDDDKEDEDDSSDEDDESESDTENLGEATQTTASAEARSQARAQAQAKADDAALAEATTDNTQGMYDAEIRATQAMASFDDTMSSLSAVVNDGESSFIQMYTQTGKGEDFGLDADEMAMTATDSKLLNQMPSTRADAEMKQWSDMSGVTDEDAEAEKSEHEDEQKEKDFGESADPVETAIVDEADTNTETLQSPGLTSYQKKEQDDALAFVNKQKAEENAVLAKAEAKEKATESKATKEVMGDLNMVKKTTAEAGMWHMKKSALKKD